MKKIGIFDSGVGGLKIASFLSDKLGDRAEIFYIADQMHAPYGDKSPEYIHERCRLLTKDLIEKDVELVVIACNTATAVAIETLRKEFSIPFVGVEPDLHFFKREKVSKDKIVGVLTTPVTPQMEKFKALQKMRDPLSAQKYVALPKLAMIVEMIFNEILSNNNFNSSEFEKKIKQELEGHLHEQFDYLVLGCTHYGLINQCISDIASAKCICPSSAVVEQVIRLLGIPADLPPSEENGRRFYFKSTAKGNKVFRLMDFSWRNHLKKSKFLS